MSLWTKIKLWFTDLQYEEPKQCFSRKAEILKELNRKAAQEEAKQEEVKNQFNKESE